MDRGVPALRPADRPRAARIARPGLERVVLALPVRAADRVDRGEVDDVEADLRQLWQAPLETLEAAPRAREELVPGAEARELGVDVELERARQPCRLGPVGRGRRQAGGDVQRDVAQQRGTFRQLAREVLLSPLGLPAQLVAPGSEAIDPG